LDGVLDLLWDFSFFVDVVNLGDAVVSDMLLLDVGAPEHVVVGFDGEVT
jgi:hypothetical protein